MLSIRKLSVITFERREYYLNVKDYCHKAIVLCAAGRRSATLKCGSPTNTQHDIHVLPAKDTSRVYTKPRLRRGPFISECCAGEKAAATAAAVGSSSWSSSCESLPGEPELSRLERRREPIFLVQPEWLLERHFHRCLSRLTRAHTRLPVYACTHCYKFHALPVVVLVRVLWGWREV